MQQEIKQWLGGMKAPVPVVLETGWVNGLGIIHGLAADGLRCIAVSSKSTGIGLHSRTAYGLVCPDPAQEPDQFVAFMLNLGQSLPGKGVLLVTDDTYLLALARARAQLEPFFIYSFPDIHSLNTMMDKWEQYRSAEQCCNVPIPRTICVDSKSDLEGWPEDAFPAILKGRVGKEFYRSAGRQVLEVNNRSELLAVTSKFDVHDLILQEIIPGGDDQLYTLGSYISPSGRVLGTFTGRKLWQEPERYGTCRLGESLDCPEVLEQGLRLLKHFGFYGVSQVEFKLDARDGKYKLIEINGRFWKWHSLATHCGVNLAALAYRDLIGQPVTPCVQQKYGDKWVMGLYEFTHYPHNLRKYWRQILKYTRVVQQPHADAIFSWQDIQPVISFLSHQITSKLR